MSYAELGISTWPGALLARLGHAYDGHAPASNLCRSGKYELVGPHRGPCGLHSPALLPFSSGVGKKNFPFPATDPIHIQRDCRQISPVLHPSACKVSGQPLDGTNRFMISA
ncbi:uncharacterized protein BDCG_16598 [Blastomyces dermatitidis ER-3]|uniref:Uncharacterized protein n=1 Tax=Ajellomyces dermatitidis (strain ER-3 / ATCC MYA-2586) TaxID=559297 RepID=A0ABX2VUG1_AJEDR|nr:uncharacterized protein BDCG_16598 [Blastomyces dermatitidis ER-3]OAT00348.1 hypothetical protein BDCG_16598 [Blastomyces dermatitidis ER-3]